MMDVVYVAATVAFFVIAAVFGRALERIGTGEVSSEGRETR